MTPARGQRSAPLYMAHVVPGLEALAWEELRERLAGVQEVATWSAVDRRAAVLLFRSNEPPQALLALRLTEDLFAVAAIERRLPPGKRALAEISDLARLGDDMVAALRCHREAGGPRPRGRPAYRVVVRKAGRHAFRRVDAQRACEAGLARRFPRWRFVKDGAGLEFWLQIIGASALLALRLSGPSMRQRADRGVSLPAALKPTVAHALVRLAAVPARGLLVDPACGTGTVLTEGAGAGLRVLGGDIEPAAVSAANENLRGARGSRLVARWDATRLPLSDAVAGGVACNLPWGKRHSVPDLAALYRGALAEARRVVRDGGRIALLTSERDLIDRLVRRLPGLTLERRLAIAVRGADAWLFALRKTGR